MKTFFLFSTWLRPKPWHSPQKAKLSSISSCNPVFLTLKRNAFWILHFFLFYIKIKTLLGKNNNSKYITSIFYWQPPFQASISNIIAFFFLLWAAVVNNLKSVWQTKTESVRQPEGKLQDWYALTRTYQGSRDLTNSFPSSWLLSLYCNSTSAKWWNPCSSGNEKGWSCVTRVLPACSSFFLLFL